MPNTAPPNYYAILGISESATVQQIRDAYKRAALKTHPDRVPADSPERATRTRQFQRVNDAYYVLSDDSRRLEYDSQRTFFGFSPGSTATDDGKPDPAFSAAPGAFPDEGSASQDQAGAGSFPWGWNFFGGQKKDDQQARQQAEEAQFGDVFEEMLREEGMGPDTEAASGKGPLAQFWGMVGGFSGGALGFIVGNLPGLVAGAVAGNRLGAVRDARGKSVYAVFQELPQADRARLLSQLAAKVFSHAVGI